MPSPRLPRPTEPVGSKPAQLRRAAGDVLPWFGWVVLLAQIAWLWIHWSDPLATSVDSSQLIVMARRLTAGMDVYRAWPEYGPHFMTVGGPPFPPDRSPYLPFLPALLTYVSEIPLISWARLMWCAGMISFWGYAAALARLAGRRGWQATLGWGSALMLTPGAWRAVAIGNIDPILWAVVGLAFLYSTALAPGLTLAAMVKVYPVWPLLAAVLREPRKTARPAIVTLVAATGAAAIAVGPLDLARHLGAWLVHVPPVMSQGSFLPWNFSLSFLPLRLLASLELWDYTPGPLPEVARAYLAIVGVAAPVATAWLTRKWEPTLQYGSVLAAAVLFAPLGWATYLPLVLAPVAVVMNSKRIGAVGADG